MGKFHSTKKINSVSQMFHEFKRSERRRLGGQTYRRGVQVSEGCSGRRIRKIISRHVHSLYGGDGTLVGRRDTLLRSHDPLM